MSSGATLSGFAAPALPLSYSLAADGIRTRDTVVTSDVSDLFTTDPAAELSGNRRVGNDILKRKANPCGESPQPASRRPLRRAPPRYGQDAGFSPRPLSWRSGWREVSGLFTTDRWFQGNERHGSGRLTDEEVRVFTTWIQSFSSVSRFSCSGGDGNKNPSGAWAREGFDQIELWSGLKPFRLRESACTGDQTPCRRRRSRSDFPACRCARRSSLAVQVTTIANEGRGV